MSAFSSTLSVVLRAHGPDLGSHSPLTRHRFCGSSIHVSRKGWHMLLNLSFHMAMTSAAFAGGITLTNYQMVCQAVSRGKGWGLQDGCQQPGHRGGRHTDWKWGGHGLQLHGSGPSLLGGGVGMTVWGGEKQRS